MADIGTRYNAAYFTKGEAVLNHRGTPTPVTINSGLPEG